MFWAIAQRDHKIGSEIPNHPIQIWNNWEPLSTESEKNQDIPVKTRIKPDPK